MKYGVNFRDVLRESEILRQMCCSSTTPDDMFVYDVFDSNKDVIVGGLAVDIGTTTVCSCDH